MTRFSSRYTGTIALTVGFLVGTASLARAAGSNQCTSAAGSWRATYVYLPDPPSDPNDTHNWTLQQDDAGNLTGSFTFSNGQDAANCLQVAGRFNSDGTFVLTLTGINSCTGYYGEQRGTLNAPACDSGQGTFKKFDYPGAPEADYSWTWVSTCGVSALSPNKALYAGVGELGRIEVTASTSSCIWSATTSANWINIVTGRAGSGSGTIAFQLAPNDTGAARTGTVSIGKQTITIAQAAAAVPAPVPTEGYDRSTYDKLMALLTSVEPESLSKAIANLKVYGFSSQAIN